MVLEEFANMTTNLLSRAIESIGFTDIILPLFVYTIAIAMYAVFIWFFYRSVSKRDLFKRGVGGIGKTISQVLKYFILFPILIFIWFGILTVLMFVLSKTQTTENILLVAVALIAAVRVMAYYRESLANDMAKILPLAILAIFLIEPTLLSIDLIFDRISQLPTLTIQLFNYLIFILILEFILRILFHIKVALSKKKKKK